MQSRFFDDYVGCLPIPHPIEYFEGDKIEMEYYEDIQLHQKIFVGEYTTSRDEMIEYAKKWDPQPYHIDDEAARSYPNGQLTAASGYTLGITTLLLTQMESHKVAALANLEYEHTKLPVAVLPEDYLTMTMEHLEKRESRSNPHRGIVHTLMEVKNQNHEIVLSYVGIALIAKRPT